MEEIIAGGASEVPGTSFASKVGGKPVWPELKGLPGSLQCKKCSKPLTFLLQFHAPLSSSSSYSSSSSGSSSLDEDSEDDPRMLLVFMCKSSSCHTPGDASCFTVLRYEGSNEDMVATHRDNIEDACEDIVAPSSGASDVKSVKQSVSTPSPLCVVCGCYGPKQCGGCRKVSYCSREHQVHDWTSGHKKTCSELSESPDNSALPASCNPSRNVCGVLLPEWDLVTEPEPASCLKEHEERSEQERMADYERYVTERGVVCEGAGLSGEALEKAAAEMEGKKDKYFRNFMKRIAPERQQVSVCVCVSGERGGEGGREGGRGEVREGERGGREGGRERGEGGRERELEGEGGRERERFECLLLYCSSSCKFSLVISTSNIVYALNV